MSWVKQFTELSKHDAATAGGKGASLGEMTQASIPVPPGYVILSSAFERFIEASDINIEIDAILKTVNVDAMHTVEQASADIQRLILEEKEIPQDIEQEILDAFKALGAEFVAVRSSATAEDSAEAAWAGQLDSFLNTTESTLLTNVRHCWASLFTPRAIFYRFEKGLDQSHISVAVVVQKMVNSDSAGIAFSVHPVTEDRNQMIIEAGFGLGEAVVSGQITPDSYVVTKEPRKILDKNIIEQKRGLFRKQGGGNEWRDISDGGAPVLSDEEIFALSETVIRIENHYGFPCDIEWAKEGNEMYIVQSRPITTLADIPEQKTILSKIYSREKSLFYFCIWHNSDVEGVRKFLGEELKAGMFVAPGKDKLGEVWYSPKELERVSRIAVEKTASDKTLRNQMVANMEEAWDAIKPHFKGDKKLNSVEEMYEYYQHIVKFWSSINTVFFELPDRGDVHPDFRDGILRMRKETEAYTDQMSSNFVNFFEETFPKFAKFSYVITPEEVLQLAKSSFNSKLISQLEERVREGCVMIDGVVYPKSNQNKVLEEKGLTLEKAQSSDVSDGLKGKVAFRGKVAGIVKIVLSKSDIQKIHDGDILVTPMTNPEHVPYMRKAAAFVTDEGGVTCHAAIVSREMKKPCIIGTKFATQVLKDGDLVEVDANEGVVRILHSQTLDLRQDDYIPAFEAAGIPLLFSDMLMQTYGTIGVLQAYADGLLKEYVRKDYNDKNLSEGVTLYSSSERFKKHLETLERVFTEAENKLGPLAIQGMREGVLAFFDLSKQVFDAYSKSDPFFTDRAFSETQHNETINKNLKQLQKIKDPYRVKINTFYLEKNNHLETLLGTLEKQLAVPRDDLRWYLISDLLAAFDGQKLQHAVLQERKRAYLQLGVAIGGGVAQNYFGKVAEDAARKLRRAYTGGDIRGVSANKGKEGTVRGVVKVINVDYGNLEVTRAAMNSMQHGQILVAQTTAPELMEACKKAKAIVTDNGGMLSHAAIVSRELNIPCVVGTEFATQVLNDGDEVEVDADNGIVRILKLANQKIEFEKVYTRDTTIIMQELWGYTCTEGIREKFGIENPHRPAIIHYMNDGSIEIWENTTSTKFLMDSILEKNTNDSSFLKGVLEEYERQHVELKTYWAKGTLTDARVLGEYIQKIKTALLNFIPYYYSAVDDRTPPAIREQALAMREKDELFAMSDTFLRNSLHALYPSLVGYETTIRIQDISPPPELPELASRRLHMTLVDGVEATTETLEELESRKSGLLFKREQVESSQYGEVRGEVAFRGVIQGKVKILRRRDQIAEVKEGDVIVSPMTTPDFLPAMRKAGAFVTDEGGITCHAGIVARELKKPCIIGTKVATQVLKDGDLVEVDANEGVVRVLNK